MRCLSWVLYAAGLAAALSTVASPAHADPAPIIGGTTTTVGQFPTVVALSVGGGLCTGTLVTPEWVLTAAHCITPSLLGLPNQAAVTSSIRIHFGTVNLGQSQGTVATASLTIPKPGFSVNNLGSNDIGLIKLTQPVANVAPTPVNLEVAKAPVGTTVTMVGYGATARGGGGTAGIEFVLENRTSTACSSFGLSDTNLLCFSQVDNKGKCQGDSGGPSFAKIDGRTMVVGVTSFGDQQCAQFGADTRTDVDRAFLLEHIPTLEGCSSDDECTGDQICFEKRCIAAPFGPMGLGTVCASGAECDSGQCAEGPDGMRCSDVCTAGAENACPDGLECLGATGTSGACWPIEDDTGCCDANGPGAPSMLFGVGLVALLLRRRRR